MDNSFKNFTDYLSGKKSNLNTRMKDFPFKKSTAIALTVIATIILYFVYLPPLNLHARETWIFLMLVQFLLILFAGNKVPFLKTRFSMLIGMFVLFILLNLTSLELFTAKKYANVINMEKGDFTEEIKEPVISEIPTLDRESSKRVASRKMGELLDLVSQFDIDDYYTQINYKDHPVRVTPLKYNGLLKYLFNFKNGLPGYMLIDIVNGETQLVKLEEGIRYSNDDILFRNVKLHTRLSHPFEIFDHMEFEIDEEGTPYWVIPTYKNKVGWFGAYDVKNVIIVNAINGKTQKFPVEECPQWIDRVYESDKIVQQLDWNGIYQLGYLNSRLAQKQAMQTTEGYNYLALNDDIYLYTGFTSVAGDQSNVGFVLSNLRTKETKFYPISSAKEVSAMASAEGAVQEKGYKSTFPLLFNIENKPTYFLSLKDNEELIKQYAFVDAKDYQRVSIGSTVKEAYEKHTGKIVENKNYDENTEFIEKSGVIEDIYGVVINGNTHYYFTLVGDSNIYVSSIKLSEKLPFLKKGDPVSFSYAKTNINEVTSFEK